MLPDSFFSLIMAKYLDFLINLLAALVGIFIVLALERQRRPRLVTRIGDVVHPFDNDPAGRKPRRWPHIEVHNAKITRWLAWVYDGDPALACRAWISFHSVSDGRRIFADDMPARWSEAHQPSIVELPTADGGRGYAVQNVQYAIDIPSGECVTIAPATRAKDEEICFGWNNESYLHNFEHPHWRLNAGRYYVRVRVTTGGREFSDAFLLVNDGPYDDFRIDALDRDSKRKIRV